MSRVLSRQQLAIISTFAVLLSILAGYLASVDYARKISTDIMDLVDLDARSQDVRLAQAAHQLKQAKLIMLTLYTQNEASPPADDVDRFLQTLLSSPAIATAEIVGQTEAFTELAAQLYQQRNTLLLPIWLNRQKSLAPADVPFDVWLAQKIVDDLNQFLEAPDSVYYYDFIESDPLLLVPGAIAALRAGTPHNTSASGTIRMIIETAHSPFEAAGQTPVFEVIENARQTCFAPDSVNMEYTGIHRFAHQSKTRIKGEVMRLNLLSLSGVILVALLMLRNLKVIAHLAFLAIFSLAAAFSVTLLSFDRVHVLALVIGSILTGIAIDYGIHIFGHTRSGPEKSYLAALRTIRAPLLTSCLSSAGGFFILLFSELPAIRQIGLFVAVGLIVSAIASVFYFSLFHAAGSTHVMRLAEKKYAAPRIQRIWITLSAAIAAMMLLPTITWEDDIRGLDITDPQLLETDQRIRNQFTLFPNSTIFLSLGATPSEALEKAYRFNQQLTPAQRATSFNLAQWLAPQSSLTTVRAFVTQYPDFTQLLLEAFRQNGFDTGELVIPPLDTPQDWDALAEDYPETLDAFLRGLPAQLAFLLNADQELAWATTLADADAFNATQLNLDTADAILLEQLQSLNQAFAHYRKSLTSIAVIGFLAIAVGVLISYSLKTGIRILLTPIAACVFSFALQACFNAHFNLFHLIGGFLGFCLAVDYALFASKTQRPPNSVRLSAMTTLVSFGVLASSPIPFASALGWTVGLTVLGAWVILETKPEWDFDFEEQD